MTTPPSGIAVSPGELRRIEPSVALALGALAVVVIVLADHPLWLVGPFALLMALGAAGLAGWTSPTALLTRALVGLLASSLAPAVDLGLAPTMLLWPYVVVATYPLVLGRRAGALVTGLAVAGVLALWPLGAAPEDVPLPAWLLRAAILGLVGAFAATAGGLFRSMLADAVARRVEAEETRARLAHVTNHDSLTGLPNRGLAEELVVGAVERSHAEGTVCAVLHVDVDRFQAVNETLGHSAGDALLIEVADRISEWLDGIPGEGHAAARLGGDEFIVALCGVSDDGAALGHAVTLIEAFDPPTSIAGQLHRTTVCVGVATSHPDDTRGAGQLVAAADAATRAAKATGTGRAVLHDESMTRRSLEAVRLENELRDALVEDRIEAVFQPVLDLDTGHVRSVEALARWSLDDSEVSPAVFVPLAERMGLGPMLLAAMVRRSLAALQTWRKLGLGVETVAVNIAARDLVRPDLPEQLADAVRAAGLPPGSLSLEITERDVVEDPQQAAEALRRLAELGIEVAVDDFGTGYSSLAYLTSLPVSVLKVDRTFVNAATEETAGPRGGSSDAMVRTILGMGSALDVRCVAEGVESSAQLKLVRQLGAHAVQGWYVARPTSVDDLPVAVVTAEAVGTGTRLAP